MHMIFRLDPGLVAAVILAHLLLISDRFDRSIVALLGAAAMIVSGVLTQDEAIRGIDSTPLPCLPA